MANKRIVTIQQVINVCVEYDADADVSPEWLADNLESDHEMSGEADGDASVVSVCTVSSKVLPEGV
jgi:hypothetical protein